jgi:hypothetical protein
MWLASRTNAIAGAGCLHVAAERRRRWPMSGGMGRRAADAVASERRRWPPIGGGERRRRWPLIGGGDACEVGGTAGGESRKQLLSQELAYMNRVRGEKNVPDQRFIRFLM